MIKQSILACALLGFSRVAQCADVPGAVVLTSKVGNVWSCSATYKVKQNTPVPTAKAAMVNISAAKNEFEPFQLVIRASKPLSSIKVTPHQLNGPGGAKIAAWNITARREEYVNVGNDYFPDPLPEAQSFNAPKAINTPVWVTVYVSDKTPAGDYTGTVDITAAGGVKLAVPVKLHVWDFALPTVSKLRTSFGIDYTGPANYSWATTLDQKRKLVDIYNNDFWRHRVSPMKPYEFYDLNVIISSYAIKVDFSDFDIAIRKYFPMFNTFMLPGFGIGDNLGLDLGSQADRLKVEYMRMVAEHLADKGQISKGYANLLNAAPAADDNADAAIDRIRRADARIEVMIDAQADQKAVSQADIAAVQPSAFDEQAAKKLKSRSIETWFYVPAESADQFLGNSINSPAVNARILPWLCWRYGVPGMMYQTVTWWKGDPYASGDPGNGKLLYPPFKTPTKAFSTSAPVPSIRWELIREGIEDYDYFRILSDRIYEAKKHKPASPAIAAATQALDMVNEAAPSVSGYNQDPAKLEAARVKVAEAIESLK